MIVGLYNFILDGYSLKNCAGKNANIISQHFF